VQISVLRPADLGAAEIAAWHAMQDQSELLANPCLCPEFAITIGRSRPGARVAVLSDGTGPIGFFPFERGRLGGATAIGMGLSDCQGLVHVPGADWDAAELLRACAIAAWQFDHLVAGQAPFARYQAATAVSPVMGLAGGFADYAEAVRDRSPRFWKDLARKTRKLEREVGALKLSVDAADVSDLRVLMRWKSDQYQRTGRPDRFDQPWVVAVVEDLMTYRTGRFRGVLSVLYAGGAPIAGHFGVAYGGVLAEWFPAYDTEFAKYSPGLIQLVKMAEDAGALGVRAIDLGKGEMRYKDQLKSYELTVAEGTVLRPSARAALHWATATPPRWAVRQIRKHPPLFTAADKVLKGIARVKGALRSGR
jgi:CelD/BcsL family acetyltransferase involved in cellulose biosynthesis